MNTLRGKLGKVFAAVLAVTLVLAVAAPTALAANRNTEQAAKAMDWIRTQQKPDGSFAGLGAGSTVDAVLAMLAAQQVPSSFVNGGKTPVDFLQSKAADLAKTPGGAGKLLLTVAALGLDGKSFGGVNLVDAINSSLDPATGHYGKDAIGQAFAMLGLKAAGETVPQKAIDLLKSVQAADGGWAFSGETKAGASDTDTTAVVVQALAALGEPDSSPAMQKALDYLRSQENADGGFPYQKAGEFGGESDVDSTAYVAQALAYLGSGSDKAVSFLLSMQKPDGAFEWEASEKDDNAEATYQAVPAILGVTLVDPNAAQLQRGNTGGTAQPGMPTTGSAPEPAWIAALVAVAALLLGTGLAAKWAVGSRQ
ncbi:MAG: prenyltransferase/squalene oxidase repeat-containing protein [Chloroflexia bacterium]